MTAYEDGKKAASNKSLTHEDNPFLGKPNKVGIRHYTDSAAGSAWATGFRDARDAAWVSKNGRPPQVSDFKRKSTRYYA